MKALTVCQPYAHLIANGAKRVENREWPTRYRGLLYIHAGKSRDWLGDYHYGIPLEQMSFGAVVAIARLIDCLHIHDIERGIYQDRYPWLREHEHTEGTWCWVLDAVSPIGPWPWKGAQGLWDIDEEELGRVANRELGIVTPRDEVMNPTASAAQGAEARNLNTSQRHGSAAEPQGMEAQATQPSAAPCSRGSISGDAK